MRSLIVSASPWSWVTKMNVIPTSRWIRLSSICIASRSFRSSAASGSSSRRAAGRFTSARARRDPLLLAARQLRRAAVGELGELDDVEHVERPPARLPGRHPLRPQAERHVVDDRHVREQGVLLEDGVDVALVRRDVRDVDPVEQDPARGRQLEAGDHLEQGGLAAPGRSEHGEELAAAGSRSRRCSTATKLPNSLRTLSRTMTSPSPSGRGWPVVRSSVTRSPPGSRAPCPSCGC